MKYKEAVRSIEASLERADSECVDKVEVEALRAILRHRKCKRKKVLKQARKQIELAGAVAQQEKYDSQLSAGWMHYMKGIRDACWTIDAMLAQEG